MKAFFKSVLRIATAMLVVVTVVGLLVWGFRAWSSYREKRENASLETPREWPPIKIEGLGSSELSLKTMWRNGRMSYVFEVEKYTGSKSKREWILHFTDSHGFKVFRHVIRDETATLGEKNEIIGFVARGDLTVKADEYRRAQEWEVSWID